jgi:hypothetical protein
MRSSGETVVAIWRGSRPKRGETREASDGLRDCSARVWGRVAPVRRTAPRLFVRKHSATWTAWIVRNTRAPSRSRPLDSLSDRVGPRRKVSEFATTVSHEEP